MSLIWYTVRFAIVVVIVAVFCIELISRDDLIAALVVFFIGLVILIVDSIRVMRKTRGSLRRNK
jgi:cell division protein FtsW (lipid II flippase)